MKKKFERKLRDVFAAIDIADHFSAMFSVLSNMREEACNHSKRIHWTNRHSIARCAELTRSIVKAQFNMHWISVAAAHRLCRRHHCLMYCTII